MEGGYGKHGELKDLLDDEKELYERLNEAIGRRNEKSEKFKKYIIEAKENVEQKLFRMLKSKI